MVLAAGKPVQCFGIAVRMRSQGSYLVRIAAQSVSRYDMRAVIRQDGNAGKRFFRDESSDREAPFGTQRFLDLLKSHPVNYTLQAKLLAVAVRMSAASCLAGVCSC